jgi:hypothetical protein
VDSPAVQAIATSGSSFATLSSGSPLETPEWVAEGNNSLYVTDLAAKTIWSVPLAGGTPSVVVTDSAFQQIEGLAFYNNALYVADSGTGSTGTIWKVSLGAAPEPGTLTLLGSAVLGVGAVCLRRRRAKA